MPSWGSKWLEREANPDASQESGMPETRAGHNGRWFNVMQGIRRSLDVHLKSYYKIDNVYASMARFTSASDKLQTLARSLTDTCLVDFCCVALVHPDRGTFGAVALSGPGSELYPPLLTSAARGSTPLNVFTRCVFEVQNSNWAVEDVVTSKAPWYYDCASAANGFGLPQDGAWLRRAGMRSVLALPCMTGSEVVGVLVVASRQTTLDHLLLRKLEELCFKVTPVVADAVSEQSLLLCSRRAASQYESISDFAHEVLGEMLNLDHAVAVSVSTSGNVNSAAKATSARNACKAAAAASQTQQQQQQQQLSAGSCSSRTARKGEEQYDAAAAVAAAAAAGFSWTAPSAPAAAAAAAAAALAQPQQSYALPAAPVRPTDSFCSVLTGVLAAPASDSQVTDVVPNTLPASASASVAAPSLPLSLLSVETASPAQSAPQPAEQEPGVHASQMTRSLPPRACAAKEQVLDYLWRAPAPASIPESSSRALHKPHPHPQAPVEQRPQACPATSDRNISRSTRSLSCLEFSGGMGATDLRDALASGGSVHIPSGAAAVTASSNSNSRASNVQHASQAPLACQPVEASSASRSPASSKRSTESGTGEGFMLETLTTEELARTQHDGFMVSPSTFNSQHTERRTIHRVCPLEASQGASAVGRAIAAPAACAAAARLAAARGSSAATEASAAGTDATATWNTNTTFAYNFSNHTTSTTGHNTATSCAVGCGGGGANTARLSALVGGDAWASSASGRGRASDDVQEAAPSVDANGLTGRWSRDSAAAAACVWNNEAAEAFAAAMHFTSSQARAAAEQFDASRLNAALALGGLYGIRESGPVPSLPLSLDGSDSFSGDCGVAVMDLASGAGLVLSSGLGAEAQQRHGMGHGSLSQSPPSGKLALAAEHQWLRCPAVQS